MLPCLRFVENGWNDDPWAGRSATEREVKSMVRSVALGIFFLIISGCSTTPGDAARRGGHYPQAAELYEIGANKPGLRMMLKL